MGGIIGELMRTLSGVGYKQSPAHLINMVPGVPSLCAQEKKPNSFVVDYLAKNQTRLIRAVIWNFKRLAARARVPANICLNEGRN